jgi:RNA polymerase subunit RPABC4/transcription elongation factor Spt4
MAEKCKPRKQFCPYCDEEIAEAQFPYCQACEAELFYCPKCHRPLARETKVCPNCGTDLTKETA